MDRRTIHQLTQGDHMAELRKVTSKSLTEEIKAMRAQHRKDIAAKKELLEIVTLQEQLGAQKLQMTLDSQ